jgi:hypothetical protein
MRSGKESGRVQGMDDDEVYDDPNNDNRGPGLGVESCQGYPCTGSWSSGTFVIEIMFPGANSVIGPDNND